MTGIKRKNFTGDLKAKVVPARKPKTPNKNNSQYPISRNEDF